MPAGVIGDGPGETFLLSLLAFGDTEIAIERDQGRLHEQRLA